MRKKSIITFLLTLFCSAFAFALLNFNGVNKEVNAKVIVPIENSEGIELEITSYVEPNLTVTVEGGGVDYEYQFWVKTKENNDLSDADFYQDVWMIEQNYSVNNVAVIELNDSMLSKDGLYNIIVRVKNKSGEIIAEILKSFTPEEVMPVISDILIGDTKYYNEAVYVEQWENVVIKAQTNNVQVLRYDLLYNQISKSNNVTGEFTINPAEYQTGFHEFEITAFDGVNTASKSFSIFIYSAFPASEVAVIESLTGEPVEGDTDGNINFTMKLKYADGGFIEEAEKNLFNYYLYYNGNKIEPDDINPNVEEQCLDVIFNIDFNELHGIYRIEGRVSRKSVNAADDRIIIYYEYIRTGSYVNQSATGTIDDDGKYVAGQKITITADGNITNVFDTDLRYAFYREDASGWVLIKDYSSNSVLEWTPVKGGIYNIQVRVMDVNGGSYEAASSAQYVVAGTAISDEIDFQILNYQTKQPLSPDKSLVAGKPYILKADYSDNLLYMFTLTTKNLGLIYLNKYSPSNTLIYVPNKTIENITLSVRVIDADNFGFKDVAITKSVSSISELDIEYNFDGGNDDLFMVSAYNSANYAGIVTDDGRSVIKATTIGGVGNNGMKIDFNGINVADLAACKITIRTVGNISIFANIAEASNRLFWGTHAYGAPIDVRTDLIDKGITTLNSLYFTGDVGNLEIYIDKIDIPYWEDLNVDYNFDGGAGDDDLLLASGRRLITIDGIVSDEGRSVLKAVGGSTGNTNTLAINFNNINVADICSFNITAKTLNQAFSICTDPEFTNGVGYWGAGGGYQKRDIITGLKNKGVTTVNTLYFRFYPNAELYIDNIELIYWDDLDVDYTFDGGNDDMLCISQSGMASVGIVSDEGRSVLKAVSPGSGSSNYVAIKFDNINVDDIESFTINAKISGGAVSVFLNTSFDDGSVGYWGSSGYTARNIDLDRLKERTSTVNILYFRFYPNITLYIDSIVITYK